MQSNTTAPGESARAPTDDTAAFVYVDTAFGGVDRRNTPRALADVRLNGVADCYVSHNRATDALVAWVATHTNDKGNPTVAGFDGPTWAPDLHLDFDSQDDPGIALGWLRGVLDRLESWGADLRAVRIYFSGNKGFHLEIPHTLFGGFAPSKDLHARMKRAATRILGDIPFDTAVYDRLRLWRLPNSKSGKTGLHKIRLTHTEARTLDLAAIRELAARPRDAVGELEPIPDDEWMPVDELVAIWDATVEAAAPERSAEPRAATDTARARQTAFGIAASWPHGGINATEGDDTDRVSRHADYLMPLVGFLVARTTTEQARAILEDGAEHAGDRSFLHDRDWQGEIARLIESADARLRPDENGDDTSERRVKGLPSIAEKFPVLAAVLGAAWPDPTLFARGEDGWFAATETLAGRGKARANGRAESSSEGSSEDIPKAENESDQEEETSSSVSPFFRRGFPTECLPGVIREYVEGAARATGAPSGFVALPLLVFAGTAAGNEHRVEIKAGYVQRPVMFGGVVAPTGSTKSPGIREARYPLDVLQAEAHERYEVEVRNFERDLRDWEALSKANQGDVPKPVKPVMGQFYTTNSTLEALTCIVRDGRGVAVAPDELTAFVHGMDAYRGGRGGDRQAFLSLWSGEPLKVDRKGQEPLFVQHPVVGVVGGIQPAVMQDLAKDGRRDGFIDRFLWDASPAPVARWREDSVDEHLRSEMVEIFRRLRDSRTDRPVILSPEAKARWTRWYDANAETVEQTSGLLRGIYSKFPLQLARIALILHCLTYPDDPTSRSISDDTMADAIDITEYYRHNANLVVEAFGAPIGNASVGLTDRILRFLRANRADGDGWVTRTAINDHLGGKVLRSDISPALAASAAAGQAEMRRRPPPGGKGGRPTEEWRILETDSGKTEKRKNDPFPPSDSAEKVRGETAEERTEKPPATPQGTESAPSCPSCRRILGLDELPCMACKDDSQCRACKSRERRYRPQHGDYVCAGERCGVNVPRPRVSEVTV